MRTSSATTALLLAVLLSCHRQLPAATIYATGFEDPPFHAGQPLIGQDGWQGDSGPNPPGDTAVISTENSNEGLQDFRIRGSDLTPDPPAPLIAIYNRKGFGFDVASEGYPRIRVEADIRLDGPQTADYYLAVFFGASTPTAQTGISISSNGVAYSPEAAQIPISLGQYNHYAIELTLGNQNIFKLSVNGEPLKSYEFLATSIFHGIQIACNARLPSEDPLHRDVAAYTVYVDNLSITTTIPEPLGRWLEGVGIVGIVALGGSHRASSSKRSGAIASNATSECRN